MEKTDAPPVFTRPTHFEPLRKTLSPSQKVINSFERWEARYRGEFKYDREMAILKAFGQAFPFEHSEDPSKWKLSDAGKVVDHFLLNPDPLYPRMFKEWCEGACKGIIGATVEDDKRFLSILAVARRKFQ